MMTIQSVKVSGILLRRVEMGITGELRSLAQPYPVGKDMCTRAREGMHSGCETCLWSQFSGG